MTLHWVSLESSKPTSVLLDFLDVFPGDGVGKCVGKALFLRLTSFSISSCILSTTFDGASESLVASKEFKLGYYLVIMDKTFYNHHIC